MEIQFLVDINCESDILGYYTEGHVDKEVFMEQLVEVSDLYKDDISIDEIEYKYARWIPNPFYDDDPDILDTCKTPKKDYFPITIYE